MLQEILFVVIVLVVATLMIVDVARTRNESFHGHGEGQAFDAKRPVAAAAAASVGSRESFSRAHVGPAMPVRACPTRARPGLLQAPAHPLAPTRGRTKRRQCPGDHAAG